jgi:hypothetical protein
MKKLILALAGVALLAACAPGFRAVKSTNSPVATPQLIKQPLSDAIVGQWVSDCKSGDWGNSEKLTTFAKDGSTDTQTLEFKEKGCKTLVSASPLAPAARYKYTITTPNSGVATGSIAQTAKVPDNKLNNSELQNGTFSVAVKGDTLTMTCVTGQFKSLDKTKSAAQCSAMNAVLHRYKGA